MHCFFSKVHIFENFNKQNKERTFEDEVNMLIDHIDGLYHTFPMVNLILKVTQMTSQKNEKIILRKKELSALMKKEMKRQN